MKQYLLSVYQPEGGPLLPRRRQGTSVIYWISDPSVGKLGHLVCGRLATQASGPQVQAR